MYGMNEISWAVTAYKQLGKIDQRYRSLIDRSVNQLVNFPNVDLDIKKIQGTRHQYRMRVARYRIIFEVIDGSPRIIEVVEVKIRDSRTYS